MQALAAAPLAAAVPLKASVDAPQAMCWRGLAFRIVQPNRIVWAPFGDCDVIILPEPIAGLAAGDRGVVINTVRGIYTLSGEPRDPSSWWLTPLKYW
jgi:hypothetical protein